MAKRKKIRRVDPEEFQATIEGLAFKGEGLVRRDDEPVFVPGTIPGEQVVAEINRRGRRYVEADLKEVVTSSPHRVEPPCPYVGHCTGCQWQHIDYGHQLEIKRGLVTDQLRRIGGFEEPPVAPTVGCDQPWSYRNHARFTIGPEGSLGFVNGTTRRFVRIDRCMIMHDEVNRILEHLQGKVGETTQLSVRCGINTDQYLIQPRMQALEIKLETGQPSYEEELGGRRFRVSSPSFFQVNTQQAEKLFQLVWARLNLSGRETVVDAYAGVGTFAALLAPHAKSVIAIEESSSAVKDAEVNIAGLSNVDLRLGRTEDVLGELSEVPEAIVLDPPRAGCHENTLKALTRILPPRVVYVSCDPATLARDLRILCDGAYDLLEVQPVDMFPHTYHTEVVATLHRQGHHSPTVYVGDVNRR